MKFVLTHPMQTHPYHPELVAGDGVAQVAQAAERAGFYGFGFTDHPAPTQRWLDSGGHDALEPFVAMAYAAAVTSTLRFIPNLIVLPYRNPLLVAKAGATLDVLSGGRFTLAVGVGYLKGEFAALGVDYDERAAIVDEALQVIRRVWTGDEMTFTGRHFELSGITAHPRPQVCPPIWIGGNTSAARRRVVTHGDGWCPFAAPAMLAKVTKTATMDADAGLVAGIEDLRRRCDAAGRDFSGIDITFNGLPGTPGTPTFNADAYLAEVERLAALGVTGIQVSAPGDRVAHAVEAIEEFGETVMRHDREEVTS
ncbi:LLM class F420-dependent oxidoreductase [Mycobacterium intracellulare]|uniref:LLM class F420-dependent oxidoreductase n=1 Tax=Mycobacterium intracellulare TaxID=1767 RepID=UPI000BAC181C|nr:LLM class F420-dependent oxidoreductase [Mycobacterium intracellulare]ASW98575.1 LLM class F420-dependent oxidoreductase [Mycobacterium intracellulare subsp. chimaera]PBA60219.1 LLM class F420-dependent oxidoreductase [Mycobacterium intracellulare subsp. chimaera]